MAEWDINRPLGECCGSGQKIEAGQEYFGALVETEEGLLGDVARIVDVTDQTPRRPEHGPFVLGDKLAEGDGVALPGSGEQTRRFTWIHVDRQHIENQSR